MNTNRTRKKIIAIGKVENPSFFRCPDCKGVGPIDEEQKLGKVSIVCDCGFHGYAKPEDIFREVKPDPNFTPHIG